MYFIYMGKSKHIVLNRLTINQQKITLLVLGEVTRDGNHITSFSAIYKNVPNVLYYIRLERLTMDKLAFCAHSSVI
jgi:hypothetical protein